MDKQVQNDQGWAEDNYDWNLYEQEIAEGIRENEIDDRVPEDLNDFPNDNQFDSESMEDVYWANLISRDLEMTGLF
jgi:hypothetical protein